MIFGLTRLLVVFVMLTACLGLVARSPNESWAQAFEVSILEFPGAIGTFARGINNHRVVVGGYEVAGDGFRRFIYKEGVFTDFVVPDGHDTQASAVNDSGHIVGRFQPDGGDVHGFLYDGTFTTLQFPGATRTEALGISERGQVVGAYSTTSTHGFLFSKGVFTSIDVPGSRATFMFDLANNGDFVGAYDDEFRRHGFVYRNGTYSDVSVPGSDETIPTSITEQGVTGGYATIGVKTIGFILSKGEFSLFDLPEATRQTRIFRMNSRGQIVGDIDNGHRGFIATPTNAKRP